MISVNDTDSKALGEIRRELVDRLPPDGLSGLDGHILVAVRFHRLVRLVQRKPDERQGAAWEAFFAEYVPHFAGNGRRLWEDWRTKLLKDDAPGQSVVISEQTPEPHGHTLASGELFIDLESIADDYTAAVDSVMLACVGDDELRATVIRNWEATRWTVRHYAWAGPPTPGTALYIPLAVSASASSSSVTATATDGERTR